MTKKRKTSGKGAGKKGRIRIKAPVTRWLVAGAFLVFAAGLALLFFYRTRSPQISTIRPVYEEVH